MLVRGRACFGSLVFFTLNGESFANLEKFWRVSGKSADKSSFIPCVGGVTFLCSETENAFAKNEKTKIFEKNALTGFQKKPL